VSIKARSLKDKSTLRNIYVSFRYAMIDVQYEMFREIFIFR